MERSPRKRCFLEKTTYLSENIRAEARGKVRIFILAFFVLVLRLIRARPSTTFLLSFTVFNIFYCSLLFGRMSRG